MKLIQSVISAALTVAMLGPLLTHAPVANADPIQASSALSAVSALPLASVVGATALAGGSAVVLAAGLGSIVIKSVEISALGTIYVLERASDGARWIVKTTGRAIENASNVIAEGALVTVSVIAAGTLLIAGGVVLCLLPSAAGMGLLHNQVIAW